MKTWLCIALIAFWMLFFGGLHMVNPEFFFPIVPDMFPKLEVVYISGVIEIMIGIMVLIPKTRALAGLAFAVLCVAFLPLHVWDLFRDDPAFTPLGLALGRIAFQFVLISAGLYLWKTRT